jgi:hypothetical protein
MKARSEKDDCDKRINFLIRFASGVSAAFTCVMDDEIQR